METKQTLNHQKKKTLILEARHTISIEASNKLRAKLSPRLFIPKVPVSKALSSNAFRRPLSKNENLKKCPPRIAAEHLKLKYIKTLPFDHRYRIQSKWIKKLWRMSCKTNKMDPTLSLAIENLEKPMDVVVQNSLSNLSNAQNLQKTYLIDSEIVFMNDPLKLKSHNSKREDANTSKDKILPKNIETVKNKKQIMASRKRSDKRSNVSEPVSKSFKSCGRQHLKRGTKNNISIKEGSNVEGEDFVQAVQENCTDLANEDKKNLKDIPNLKKSFRKSEPYVVPDKEFNIKENIKSSSMLQLLTKKILPKFKAKSFAEKPIEEANTFYSERHKQNEKMEQQQIMICKVPPETAKEYAINSWANLRNTVRENSTDPARQVTDSENLLVDDPLKSTQHKPVYEDASTSEAKSYQKILETFLSQHSVEKNLTDEKKKLIRLSRKTCGSPNNVSANGSKSSKRRTRRNSKKTTKNQISGKRRTEVEGEDSEQVAQKDFSDVDCTTSGKEYNAKENIESNSSSQSITQENLSQSEETVVEESKNVENQVIAEIDLTDTFKKDISTASTAVAKFIDSVRASVSQFYDCSAKDQEIQEDLLSLESCVESYSKSALQVYKNVDDKEMETSKCLQYLRKKDTERGKSLQPNRSQTSSCNQDKTFTIFIDADIIPRKSITYNMSDILNAHITSTSNATNIKKGNKNVKRMKIKVTPLRNKTKKQMPAPSATITSTTVFNSVYTTASKYKNPYSTSNSERIRRTDPGLRAITTQANNEDTVSVTSCYNTTLTSVNNNAIRGEHSSTQTTNGNTNLLPPPIQNFYVMPSEVSNTNTNQLVQPSPDLYRTSSQVTNVNTNHLQAPSHVPNGNTNYLQPPSQVHNGSTIYLPPPSQVVYATTYHLPPRGENTFNAPSQEHSTNTNHTQPPNQNVSRVPSQAANVNTNHLLPPNQNLYRFSSQMANPNNHLQPLRQNGYRISSHVVYANTNHLQPPSQNFYTVPIQLDNANHLQPLNQHFYRVPGQVASVNTNHLQPTSQNFYIMPSPVPNGNTNQSQPPSQELFGAPSQNYYNHHPSALNPQIHSYSNLPASEYSGIRKS